MKVITRSGVEEPMRFDKIADRLDQFTKDLHTVVDTADITRNVILRIYDGVTTTELDELTIQYCLQHALDHPDYGKLASRIAIDNHHKETSASFLSVCQMLMANKDLNGDSSSLICQDLMDIVSENHLQLESMIDYDRDFLIDCFGFKTLQRGYLLKTGGVVVERPQHLWMRVSLGIHGADLEGAKETYDLMSQKYFIHATPTLFHAGSRYPQLSSCFLMGADDSVEGIYKALGDCAVISKHAGGIGVHLHDIRSQGGYIRSTGGTSHGLVPLLKTFNATSRHINQSGKRNGSFAMYLEPHHPDILDFIEAKKPQGNEDSRARDLFYALWISDLFMQRVEAGGKWSVFDADTCQGLSGVHGAEYTEMYEKFEAAGCAKATYGAREIWQAIIESQIESGVPYMLYKDSANRKSNQQNLGTIRSSNLCAEIIEYSDSKEYAVCNLASVSLPMFVSDGVFDFAKLRKVVSVVTRNLNLVIDKTFYPLPETRLSNLSHRPMGIGVQGLADTFVMMDFAFDSPEAAALNAKIFEHIYYAAVEASMHLAQVQGPYKSYAGSPMSKGQFQFDLWGESPPADSELDWDALRKHVAASGVRNSLLVAPMPTASTSQILGNNECIEPFTGNVYMRRTLAGEFIVANKHLTERLVSMGMWNADMKNRLLFHKGSVQNIPGIPDDVKRLFKTAWELKQKVILDLAVARGRYVCQSQSLNLFVTSPTFNVLSSIHMYGWRKGLKTGSYYIRSKPAASAQSFTLDPSTEAKLREELKASQGEQTCDTCSA